MGTPLYTFTVFDQNDIRDNWLRTYRAGLIRRGVTSPNVTPGSDAYVEAQAFANELAVVEANAVIKCDELMEDTATGEALERLANRRGLSKRAAAGSAGPIVFDSSADSLVAVDAELIDGAGLRYKVIVGGTYSDGDTIPITAIDTGDATNLAEDDSLRWVSAPPFSAPTALVGVGGLVNGVDAEDDETLRARLLARMQSPPGGGNAQHVAELAEAASPSVQKAFTYPAIEGPGTFHVAVVAAPTATNKSRAIAAATLTGTITPYVQGNVPEHVYSVITNATDTNTDVAIALTLPSATTGSPPGPGGGWVDGSPWPSVDGTSYFKVTVTAVVSTTSFTVDAQTAPTPNVSRIAWLSPTEWKLYTAVVTAFTGAVGAYDITIDTPFVGITTGCYVWPQCAKQDTYVAALLAAYQLMGPGEKSANASALVRGFRHPPVSTSWPSSLGPHILRALADAGDEVFATQFLYRSDGTTTINGASGIVSAQVPASVSDPPNIFIPRHIGFYQAT